MDCCELLLFVCWLFGCCFSVLGRFGLRLIGCLGIDSVVDGCLCGSLVLLLFCCVILVRQFDLLNCDYSVFGVLRVGFCLDVILFA